jgi:hypothetical protein
MAKGLIVAVISFVTPCLSAAVHAEQIACFPRSQILPGLNRNAGEAVVARGLLQSGEMIELLTTRDGTTWTLLISPPSKEGFSCLMTSGFSWSSVTGNWGEPL